MNTVQLTFRGLERSEAVAEHVSRQADKLSTFCGRITSCRVAIEAPHRHQHAGHGYRVRIDLAVPGDELVVTNHALAEASTDVHAAVDATFDQAKRRLKEYASRRRGDVKTHAARAENSR
jgi:ribosome-associated translation inhibitor RaiA